MMMPMIMMMILLMQTITAFPATSRDQSGRSLRACHAWPSVVNSHENDDGDDDNDGDDDGDSDDKISCGNHTNTSAAAGGETLGT